MNRAAQKFSSLQSGCQLSEPAPIVAALAEVVPNLRMDKEEFETSEDHSARLKRISDALNDTVDGVPAQLMFCVRASDVEHRLQYDADRRVFTMPLWSFVTVHNVNRRTGSYQSSTRMGVKAKVTSYIDIDYRVAFTNKFSEAISACLKREGGLESVKFYVGLEKAPLVKAGGYIAFFGSLQSPFFEKDEQAGNPTLDDPTDEYSVAMSAKVYLNKIVMLPPSGPPVAECSVN